MVDQTLTLQVQIDRDRGWTPRQKAAAIKAVARVLNHACEGDIDGAAVLDSDIGQISVTLPNAPPRV